MRKPLPITLPALFSQHQAVLEKMHCPLDVPISLAQQTQIDCLAEHWHLSARQTMHRFCPLAIIACRLPLTTPEVDSATSTQHRRRLYRISQVFSDFERLITVVATFGEITGVDAAQREIVQEDAQAD